MVLMKPTALFVTTQSSQNQIKGKTKNRVTDIYVGATDLKTAATDQTRGTVPAVLSQEHSTVPTTTASRDMTRKVCQWFNHLTGVTRR